MFKFIFFSSLVIALIFSITACNQSEPQSMEQPDFFQSMGGSDAEFLLVAYSDPLEIEQEEAFIVDGAGPMYFWVLDLTEEQRESIKAVVSELRPDFKEMCSRWTEGKSWEDIHDERLALREKIRTAIYEILTDEQKVIVDKIADQLAKGEYPDIVVEKRIEYLTEQLNLADEQQTKIYDLFKQYGSLMIAARNASENPMDFRIAKYELFQELDSRIREILTEGQNELYDELKSKHRKLRFNGRFGGRFHNH